jgi:subtilase family protein
VSRRRLLVVLGVVCVALWVVVAIVVVRRDDGDQAASGGRDYPRIREELLEDIQPDPDCPDAEPAPTPGDGEVLVSMVRAVDGCLRYSAEAVADDAVADRLEELRDEPDVVGADRAVMRPPLEAAGAPEAPDRARQDDVDQWALAPEHLNGEEVRGLWPAGADDVQVAVLDNGIDGDHADLVDQVVERVPWAPSDEVDDEHGTHIAGVVAAADDGEGVIGLTPAARLVDVQYRRGDDWVGPGHDIGEYIRWAVDHGADVLNMSFGSGSRSDTEQVAVLYAELRGVVLVAGAGNCGMRVERMIEHCGSHNEVFYPAGYEQVLSVANHNADGERSATSSANSTVDIAAPGDNILSTCPTDGSDLRRTCEDDGTSIATPFVAATAALLRARQPDATPAAIREAITRSARTEHHQPVDTRTDQLGWGLLDPGAAAEYLDAHPGEPMPRPGALEDRTQAAYVHDGTLYAYDGEASSPVREVGSDHSVQSVVWSTDHTRLVGADDGTLFSWGGPGSELVEAECDACAYNEIAYLDRVALSDPADTAPGDLVVTLADDGTLTRWSPETLEPQGSVALGVSAAGGDSLEVLQGSVGGSLLVLASGGVDGQDVLWTVDPFTGEGQVSHDVIGGWSPPVAVDAAGTQVAYVDQTATEDTCSSQQAAVILDAESLTPTAQPVLPADVVITDLFFDGATLYATAENIEPNAAGQCPTAGTAGVWRAGGERWEQVDTTAVAARPLEGLVGDHPTGWILVTGDGQGSIVPASGDGQGASELGTVDMSSYTEWLWATPTREEVPRGEGAGGGGGGGGTPGETSGRGDDGGGGGGGAPSESLEGAIARYEEFLHALGAEDLETICEISGPAFESGGAPVGCEEGFTMVFDMISDEQAAALQEATIDASLVVERDDGEVEVPVEAIVADVAFGEDELGDTTLRFQDGDWYIID